MALDGGTKIRANTSAYRTAAFISGIAFKIIAE